MSPQRCSLFHGNVLIRISDGSIVSPSKDGADFTLIFQQDFTSPIANRNVVLGHHLYNLEAAMKCTNRNVIQPNRSYPSSHYHI